ncbi:FAD-dependent oxidoreductase [Pseudoxanthomonas broegbernensis]|uniref:FAD-dependent oxidoreductase n=1 Tax=Pseudoxanthomonas broegbernensis TaxID=83619 RepID=A0A7V8GP16_9GAMM|nr:FAD-binding oxidoreductase [Pseudoxanthomonas broegbernensis]KAF1687462.1 FAD-dependent oxidoreductase [Pseudoxanthomonas broegbernensis]MBB6064461.1 gamma-glutamylputrescine oxidase [Pseudoxanthomonas broegbernensis]
MTAPAADPPSWYAASAAPLAEQPALCGRIEADVCILGAGYTGLSAALELAQAGYRVAVLEARRVGWGASGRNGGQAIAGYGCGQATLENMLGRGAARALFDLSREGMDLLRARIARHRIACDWRDGHAHVPVRPRQARALRRDIVEMAQRYDYPLQWWDRPRLRAELDSERYLGAVYDPASGHLHPLEYARGLARAALAAGVRIFEHSPVRELVREPRPRLRTDGGEVAADFAVIAGNAWLRGIAPELESRIMPVGTYIAATAPLGQARARALIRNDMAVADVNWALDYFRLSRDHRLLFGGRASYSSLPPPNLRGVMRRRIRAVFPQLAQVPIDYLWGGYVDISLNRAPHWGRLTPKVYFAQGFSGHGVASTGLAGRLIAEAIRGQSQRLDLFAKIPHAPFPGGRIMRTPLLVLAMAWYKLRDALW